MHLARQEGVRPTGPHHRPLLGKSYTSLHSPPVSHSNLWLDLPPSLSQSDYGVPSSSPLDLFLLVRCPFLNSLCLLGVGTCVSLLFAWSEATSPGGVSFQERIPLKHNKDVFTALCIFTILLPRRGSLG